MEHVPETSTELRVAIRYTTSNVPGLIHDRARRVANDFALWKLQRHFSYNQDFVHCPSDFDTDLKKTVWILCDFNIRNRLDDVEVVPLQCWKVKYSPGGYASFSDRSTNVRHFTNHYPWGGRNNEWEFRLQRVEAALSDETKSAPSITTV